MSRRYTKDNNKFYHSREWAAVRAEVLTRDAFQCQVCKRAGRLTIGTTVHHIIPVRVDPSKKLDPNNLETICRACHNKEHTERTKTLHDKQVVLKAQKSDLTAVFKSNPETW